MGDNLGPDADLTVLFRRWSKLLWRRGMRPVLERLLEVNLTTAESMTMRSLQQRPLTVAEVGQLMHLSHSAASRAVDRLVQDGFVVREEDPDDRRQKRLTLSKKGLELVDRLDGAFAAGLAPLVHVLSEKEQDELKGLLLRMIQSQDPPAPEAGPPDER